MTKSGKSKANKGRFKAVSVSVAASIPSESVPSVQVPAQPEKPSAEAMDVSASGPVISLSRPATSAVPRSIPANGRIWKSVQRRRSSAKAYAGTAALKKTWTVKLKQRSDKAAVNEKAAKINQEITARRLEMKRRAEQREQQKAENEKKSRVVQVIKDSSKIKRMSKKQLKSIEKA